MNFVFLFAAHPAAPQFALDELDFLPRASEHVAVLLGPPDQVREHLVHRPVGDILEHIVPGDGVIITSVVRVTTLHHECAILSLRAEGVVTA